jgi:hypothetical protein
MIEERLTATSLNHTLNLGWISLFDRINSFSILFVLVPYRKDDVWRILMKSVSAKVHL